MGRRPKAGSHPPPYALSTARDDDRRQRPGPMVRLRRAALCPALGPLVCAYFPKDLHSFGKRRGALVDAAERAGRQRRSCGHHASRAFTDVLSFYQDKAAPTSANQDGVHVAVRRRRIVNLVATWLKYGGHLPESRIKDKIRAAKGLKYSCINGDRKTLAIVLDQLFPHPSPFENLPF